MYNTCTRRAQLSAHCTDAYGRRQGVKSSGRRRWCFMNTKLTAPLTELVLPRGCNCSCKHPRVVCGARKERRKEEWKTGHSRSLEPHMMCGSRHPVFLDMCDTCQRRMVLRALLPWVRTALLVHVHVHVPRRDGGDLLTTKVKMWHWTSMRRIGRWDDFHY